MKKLGLLFLAFVLMAAPAWAQQQYSFTTINFPGASLTSVFGLNDHGQFVGIFRAPRAPHAIRFDGKSLGIIDPDGFLGQHRSFALATNNQGDAVGAYFDADGTSHGYVYSHGVVTPMDFPGATLTQTFGINDHGVMIGIYEIGSGPIHGFTFRDGVYNQLDFPGAVDTFPLSINNQEAIVGSWDSGADPLGHGFVHSAAGEFTSVDVPGAAPASSEFISINDHGQILGSYFDGAGKFNNFVLTDGIYQPVVVPNATFASVQTLNNRGQIVGYFDDAQGRHGFLATLVAQ